MRPQEPHHEHVAVEIFRQSLVQALLIILAACVVGGVYLLPAVPSDEKPRDRYPRDESAYGLRETAPHELLVEAHDFFERKDWENAARAYRDLTDSHPDLGLAWHRLAYVLHMQGKLEEAIPNHLEAAKFPPFRAVSLYNLGCAYSLKRDKTQALLYLRKAVEAGFRKLEYFDTDTDLDYVRNEPEFKELRERVAQQHSHVAVEAAGLCFRLAPG